MSQIYPLCLFLLSCCLWTGLSAQDVLISQGGTVLTCGTNFLDGGGQLGNHAASGTREVITICAGGGAVDQSHVQLAFSLIDIQGTLTLLNGPDETADTLRQFGRESNGDRISVSATAANNSGCITVIFESDGTKPGWEAEIRCVAACQPIIAELASSVPAAFPAVNGYIDLCVGDPLTLTGRGVYPENNSKYAQSDARSTFTWNFQDGTSANGQTVAHRFTEPGGYLIELDITDEKGCKNTNSLSQRVRVVGPPEVAPDVAGMPLLCPGDAIRLGLNGDAANDLNFTVRPAAAEFNARQPVSDSVAIPGDSDELTQSFLQLRDFAPGQRLTSADDIEEICVTIEHSFIGDLSLWIECPGGQRVNLLRVDPSGTGATNQRFGFPDRNPGGPGEPLTYCFSARGAQTVAEVARGLEDTPGAPPTMPSELLYLPLEGGFDDFLGCALNGDWSLNVIDFFAEDDGTVFSWSIKFDDKLVPPREAYAIPVTTSYFADSGIYSSYAADQVTFTADKPGYANQRIVSIDSVGCTYDTLFPVQIRSPYSPLCFSCPPPALLPEVDTIVCAGESFTPDLFPEIFGQDERTRWEAFTDEDIRYADFPVGDSYTSTLTVTDHVPNNIGDPAADIAEVCVNYTGTGTLSGLEVSLLSPAGQRIVLIPRGSLTGTSVNQCFIPDGSATWEALRGTRFNGNWVLQLSDPTTTASGRLQSWSLDLIRRPTISYTWTPASSDLSCTDCPNPTITPTADGRYTLNVRTGDGCFSRASINLTIKDLAATFTAVVNDGCAGQDDGSITLVPVGDVTGLSYQWSNGATSQNVSGLAAGDYQLTVSADNGCTGTFDYTIAPAAPLTVQPEQVSNVSCFGAADGSIRVSVSGGTAPYTYTWSEIGIGTEATADGLPPGSYSLVVTDDAGCSSAFAQLITEPDSLALSLEATPVSCRDGADGTVSVFVGGGSPTYTYRWSNGATSETLNAVPAGTYSVTVTDNSGCEQTADIQVEEPTVALTISLLEVTPGCAGTSTTEATVVATGGGGNYTYVWSDLETGPAAIFLPDGEQSVSVTDDNGCTAVLPIFVSSKSPVVPEIQIVSDRACAPVAEQSLEVADTFRTYRWSTGATTPAIAGLADGTTYGVTVTDAEGCTGSADLTFQAPKPTTFDVAITPVTCFGTATGGLAVSNVSGPGPGPYGIQWGPGGDFADGPVITERPAGSYALSITDAAGCTVDTSLTIPTPELLLLAIDTAEITCFGADDGQIFPTITGGVAPYRYAWSTGAASASLTDLAAGTYSLTVTDAKGCTSDATATLESPGEIIVDATTIPGTCGGEASGRIDILATGGREPIEYSINNSNFTGTPRKVGYTNGIYIIRVRDDVGCLGRDTVEVDNTPAFRIDLGPDIDLVFGDSVTLSANLTRPEGEVDYFWSGSYAGTLSCVDCARPVAQPPYAIDYTLVAIDGLGCEAVDRMSVRVQKIREVAVPTGFTPDGDGRNDRLLVHGRPGTRVLEWLLFDRWGGLIFQDRDFEVNDPTRGWDGTGTNTQPMNAGVYLYKVIVEHEDGSQETLSGQTTLIR